MAKRLNSSETLMSAVDAAYKELCDFIVAHGGTIRIVYPETGLPDYIYCIGYTSGGEIGEFYVHGVRCLDGETIEVCSSYYRDENDDLLDDEAEWDMLQCGDYIDYIPTLFNIVECIHEYV